MKSLALAAIRGYQQMISPVLPKACRFEPTCSHYSYEAVEKHGVVRGVWLSVLRLTRCHPLHTRGYDPVP